jgi:transposase
LLKKYLDLTTIPEPKQRAKKESKLDKFKEYIVKKLHEGPFTAVRLFREIQERGFTGKRTIVRDFVRKVRPEYGVQAVLRYETKPGVQAQVDLTRTDEEKELFEYWFLIQNALTS